MTVNFWEDNRELLSMVYNATAGASIYPPGGRWGPRIQPNLQFVLVHTGHAHIHVDDEAYFVPAGYVALLHPGHREMFYFADNMETRHRWIHIQLNESNPEIGQKLEGLPRYIPLSDTMNHLTDALQSLTHSSTQDNQDQLRCTLAVAAIMLYQTESQNGWLEKGKHPSVVRAKAEIHKNYEDPLTLHRLAAISNVSAEYLIRLFNQYEGVTPMRYLWKVRADRALELLQSTGLTLDEIAEQTGFKSTYHLSRMIKNFSGKTPTDIRRSSWRGTLAE
ncbi:AraC family transcriptional regulator [Paenibacillus validus]|uniref:Helix-turn-helix domain-containing protein n=1 Tax=Paenibacillus validus TaxID=44253 RepID=A0A7X2ZCU6_9BACL|nr:AraC family transcriptional regulator [Paenibacillus validus]MED4604205.1 AraC family transcriptional regulator [Paenibacillus validus]MED4609585.1 AraC family transcriptional regulator [Paenibacillus validus]MUG71873.1 helix-turn-helix domain-containing protein [Paenibacillus validus]